MSQDQQTYRYAVMAAVTGFIVQLVLSLTMLVTAFWAKSPALTATTWYFFAGLPVWAILILINNQHRLERAELLETEALARTDAQAAAIFDEHGIDLQIARRRLDRLYKWGLNAVSLLLAVYLLAIGIWLFVRYYNGLYGVEALMTPVGERARGGVLVTITVVLAFFAFLVARYVSGMTRVKEWQLLRGGAAYLMANTVVVVLIVIASLVMAWNVDDRTGVLFKPLAVIVPTIMILVGFEICIMFLLGAYRPRRSGERPRPAFDSRVLGIFTSPESIGRIITETVNYQFGLELSRSWFYRLLARAITPLIIIGLVVLLLLSMFVIVGPHEAAVITRFGQIVGDPVSSGLHLKMPWPISRTEKYAVGRVHQVSVGSITTKLKKDVAILWTNPHSEGQEQYLITAPSPWKSGRVDDSDDASAGGPSATGMALVAADVIIQFRIADLKKYVRSSVKPSVMLTALSERRVSTYFVTHDIDTLLSRGRLEAGRTLKSQIQVDTDLAGLGIEIVFVGLTGIHPPQAQQVAAAFHEQIGALQEKETVIEQARQTAIETLAKVAGSRDEAMAISGAIYELAELQEERDRRKGEQTNADKVVVQLTRQINEKSAEVERLLMTARGEAATKIYEARAYRRQFEITERAKAERFKSELKAHDQAPQYYRARQYLDALARGLKDARKIIMTTEAEGPTVIRLDLKDVSSDFEGLLGGP